MAKEGEWDTQAPGEMPVPEDDQAEDGPSTPLKAEQKDGEAASADETSGKKPPAKRAPAKKTPAVKKTPVKKTPAVKKTPVKRTPAKKTPAKETPAEENAAEDGPADDHPAEETPTKKRRAPAKKAKATPAKKTKATPAKKTKVVENPAAKSPMPEGDDTEEEEEPQSTVKAESNVEQAAEMRGNVDAARDETMGVYDAAADARLKRNWDDFKRDDVNEWVESVVSDEDADEQPSLDGNPDNNGSPQPA